MKNKIIAGGIILALASLSTLAAGTISSNPGDLYRDKELSFDAFGSASLGNYTLNNFTGERARQNVRFGAGGGINYFMSRNFGIGVDGYSENTSGPFVDNVSANLILRFPLGQSGFSPYIFGGGGYQFDQAKLWSGQAGVGMEYRFTPHMGIFLDARGVLPNETKYYGVGRLGMRMSF